MNFQESFLTALDSLLANKLRAILTMLGIIIGVAAVIALLAIGNGFGDFIEGEVNSLGSNLIIINTDRDNSDGYPTLTLDDVEALSDPSRAPALAEVAASVSSSGEVIASGQDSNASILGVTASFFSVNNLLENLAIGDFFYEADIDSRSRVAVIGYDVQQDLFADVYPIGENIKINGVSYEVIGVLDDSEGGIAGSTNGNVYLPVTTALSRLDVERTRRGESAVSTITANAINEEANEAALEQIAEVLREEHNILYASDDDFTLTSQADLLDTVSVITGTLTLFLGAIAGISLLVGGIGIMNIMLVSVTERTREIGIRKAIGALRRDILSQFLIESLVLSLVGGLIGMALGWILSVVGGNLVDVTAVVEVNTIALAVGFSMAVGLIFGIYPAWRAANLRPIEALRYE